MEKFDLENFPVSESAKNMIASVSDGFYDNSYVGKWLYEVMGQEYDTAREIAEDILNQLFPETATWGLMYHEIKWGLPVRENLPYEERRQLIYRKRDYRAPMTPYRMEGYLKTATGFDVRIADINDPGDYGFVAPHPNVFKAYFMGEGTLASKRARAMLNELKQSHTMFTMNDRTEIVSDNRNLEEMNLKKVIFHIAESFWYSDLLDGRKLLDGSSLLYPYMRYNLMLGFKYILGGFTTPTDADLQKVKFRAKQETENDVKAGAIRIASDIIFWNTYLLDGSWDLDGSHRLDVTRGYQLGVAIVAMVACAYNKVADSMKVRSTYGLRSSSDARAAIRSEFEADFWNTVYLDGKLLLDGNAMLEYRGGNKRLEAAVTHHMGIEREDVDVEAQVITKTRNYWFLDGSNTLDGKKNLNSIYRNINKDIQIGMMCPSVMISGAGNFPVKKKEKQVAAWDRNHEDYKEVEAILGKIEAIFYGKDVIKSDDENAIEKLQDKVDGLREDQERMKQANKAIRMKDKEKGDAMLHDMGYTDEQIAQLREPDFCGRIGFSDYILTNNNANIRRLEGRIKSLQKTKSQGTQESENKFFKVKENVEAMRIQLFFEGKPEPEVRDILKSNGFRWAPSVGAWQRQLNNNGKYAVERVVRELEEMEAVE